MRDCCGWRWGIISLVEGRELNPDPDVANVVLSQLS